MHTKQFITRVKIDENLKILEYLWMLMTSGVKIMY